MTLPDAPPASLRLRIDTAALADNWRTMDRLSGSATAGAAVKANGYGLGIDFVMPALLGAGARNFFVAHWSEVAGVLAYTAGETIAVLHGVADEQEAAYARATGAVPVINSLPQARLWLQSGGGRCHLMVDSGINRLGVEPGNLGDPVLEKLEIDTLMSHLASADEESAQNARQLAVFREAASRLPAKRLSLGNSAGIMLGEDYHFDLTRPGLALYGGVPRSELAGLIRQVAHVESAVLQLRDLSPGDAVGYNAVWHAERPTRAATLALGYADGILRAWGKAGAVQHEGHGLPIIGKVSMDMIIVDCTGTNLAEGDFCNLSYDLPQASALTGLSQYELLTLLGNRFDRTTQIA
ncbi:alanine racemase [Aurantiacibacter poecillastricola]|uniref:alanine racemase n=1 Tax=Aurantiacibacter poecillastricola TaxID=3064385 RepID=UPI00273DA235|nr:alanine racemase [Aurantiacibacter sp. 219JJ12-13]MDP5262009.1 alanine racemase [Aurantiacibacter sp. 219JJ12-13]